MRKYSERGGPALFRLVRFWSRRWTHTTQRADEAQAHVGHVQVLEAIDAVREAERSASVGAVADALGLDPSGASRLISAAVAAGYVRKLSAADDARRVNLAVAPKGAGLLRAARAWQQDSFERMVAGWSEKDVARLTAYLERLANETLLGDDNPDIPGG